MADTSMALAVIPENGTDAYRMSTNAATACAAIVRQTASTIQGKKYVACTGWQAIAVAHGCTASACNVERIEGGFRATGQVRRMDTGAIIAEAEGFVGEDEPTWFGGESRGKMLPKRPDFAIRAMAQTRAISRACRSAFAHVVVLIDKNLGTTPAEEVQGVIDHDPSGTAPFASNALEQARQDIIEQNGGETRSTYQIKHADKSAGRMAAELWASQALGVLQTPGFDTLSFKDWKLQPCTNKGTKNNGQKLEELREKHPDLADKIDTAADALPLAAA